MAKERIVYNSSSSTPPRDTRNGPTYARVI